MIYTITTLKTIYGYKNPVHQYELGLRCVGWYRELKDAQRAVDENQGDIYEEGYYPFCVIEKISEGLYGITFEEYWFKWIGDGYKEIQKPKELYHVCGFGMG